MHRNPAPDAAFRWLPAPGAEAIIPSMQAQAALPANPQQLRESLLLVLLSGAALVLASMDQCTRGPSVTGMVLSNLHRLF